MIKYSNGNKKIGKDTIIINMGSAKDCPSLKLGLCQLSDPNKCYAMKPERMYPQTLPFRTEQAKIWKSKSAKQFTDDIKKIINSKVIKIKYVRFNESGDFYSQDCVKKLSSIAAGLKGIAKVYTYTARKDLNFSNLSDNLTLTGSGFMIHNEFKSVNNVTSRINCPGDCRTCHICKTRHNVKIEVLNH